VSRSAGSGVKRPEERIFLGVLRVVLAVRGAQSLKDRRQGVLSVRDRMTARFDVSFHEIGGEDHQRRTVVVTTAGNDPRVLRSVLDQCLAVVREHPVVEPAEVDLDVFRWHPEPGDWAARMMSELGSPDGPPDEDDADE
jgi:uncharacterized protein YlxP (DUF503 family)